MADVVEWNPVDDANTNAPPNGWPEFMQPSAVNNCARAMMGAVRRMYDQLVSGSLALPYLKLNGGGTVTGPITATGAIGGLDVTASRNMSVGGTLYGGAVSTTGDISSSADIYARAFVSNRAAGQIGLYLPTADASVGGLLTGGSISTAGPLTAGAVSVTGDITTAGALVSNRGAGQLGLYLPNANASIGGILTGGSIGTAGGLAVGGNSNFGGQGNFGGNVYLSSVLPNSDFAGICGSLAAGWHDVVSYNYVTLSDAALKTDLGPLPDTLALVAAIAPQAFRYGEDDLRHYGFVAQDVRAALGDLPVDIVQGEEGRLGLDYGGLTAVLWQAVRSLAARVQTLEARLAVVEGSAT
jgi:hypothetical protein